jgi:O-antigen/teichoic acid export membrane protein
LAKNALANVASGTSAALLAIILPPILVRTLSRDIYSTWALILQIGAYTGLLNFGIQVAIGRFVAHYDEMGETSTRDQLISTAWMSVPFSLLVWWILYCILAYCPWVNFASCSVGLAGLFFLLWHRVLTTEEQTWKSRVQEGRAK